MRALSLFIAVLMSFSAWAGNGERSLTIHQFTKAMSQKHSQLIPKRLRNIEVQDLVISEGHIAFKLRNFPLHIELVHSKKIAMKVNGVAFSPEDFKNNTVLKKQIIKKFNLYPKKFSLLNLLIPQANAVYIQANVPESVARNLMNSGYQVRIGGNMNQGRRYKDMSSLIAAVNAAGAEGPNLMMAIMNASYGLQHQGFQQPSIEPFRLKSSKSST